MDLRCALCLLAFVLVLLRSRSGAVVDRWRWAGHALLGALGGAWAWWWPEPLWRLKLDLGSTPGETENGARHGRRRLTRAGGRDGELRAPRPVAQAAAPSKDRVRQWRSPGPPSGAHRRGCGGAQAFESLSATGPVEEPPGLTTPAFRSLKQAPDPNPLPLPSLHTHRACLSNLLPLPPYPLSPHNARQSGLFVELGVLSEAAVRHA